jgi:DNA-binding transcriptional regulator GbsR (MarR family)
MTQPQSLTRDKLKTLIEETETSLEHLKVELAHRDEQAQHDEVEHFAEHLDTVENGLRSVRDLFRFLTEEFRRPR